MKFVAILVAFPFLLTVFIGFVIGALLARR